MRQVPKTANKFILIFPFFLIIVIDVMSTSITGPVFAYAVQHPELHILGLYANTHQRHIFFGWLKSIVPFCNILGTLILGCYSDYIGRRKILVICVIGTLLGLLGYIISFTLANFTILFVASMIIGFTAGSAAVAQAAMADISTPMEKAKNISMIALALTLGFVLSSALGGVLADPTIVSWFNKKTPLYFAFILSFISLFIAFFYLKETHHNNEGSKRKLLVDSLHLVKTFHQLTFKNNISFILLVFLFFELGWGIYFNSISLTLVQTFSSTQHLAGLFPSYVGIIMSLGLFYGVRFLTQRFTLSTLSAPSLLIGTVAMVIGFIIRKLWIQWLIAMPIALIVAFTYSSLIAMASNKVNERYQGALMSITDALLALAFMIDGFIVGKTTIHDALWPQMIGAIFLFIAFLIYPLAKRQYKRS